MVVDYLLLFRPSIHKCKLLLLKRNSQVFGVNKR